MGGRDRLFYEFDLDQVVPADHLVRRIDGVLDLRWLHADGATVACVYSGATRRLEAASTVLVTTMEPDDGLYHALAARHAEWAASGLARVVRIGDCLAPGTIAAAVWSGHRFARELGAPAGDEVPFRRENIELSPDTKKR